MVLRSPRLVAGFTRYLRFYFARSFHAVRVSRAGLPDAPHGRPLIVYTNHPSWWDPALFFLLAAALLPGRPGFGPMDAGALAQYRVLRRFGVFGLEPGRPGAARFLRLADRILADPANMLWITAQGAFTDARARPVALRPGLAHAARRAPGAVLLPLAIEYTFWNERKPEALARFGPPVALDPALDTRAATERLAAELARGMDALAAEARRRDPALFVTVQHGATGVGGLYDVWRRGRAWLSGRRFDPSHERELG